MIECDPGITISILIPGKSISQANADIYLLAIAKHDPNLLYQIIICYTLP